MPFITGSMMATPSCRRPHFGQKKTICTCASRGTGVSADQCTVAYASRGGQRWQRVRGRAHRPPLRRSSSSSRCARSSRTTRTAANTHVTPRKRRSLTRASVPQRVEATAGSRSQSDCVPACRAPDASRQERRVSILEAHRASTTRMRASVATGTPLRRAAASSARFSAGVRCSMTLQDRLSAGRLRGRAIIVSRLHAAGARAAGTIRRRRAPCNARCLAGSRDREAPELLRHRVLVPLVESAGR